MQGLLALRDWLKAHAVTQVAMEAIGVYWKAPWAILEDEFDCLLVNARHVKQVPGRKSDVSDAAWLAQLLEAGLLQASFAPPKPILALRNLTRYRKTQIEERQREANRLDKIVEDTGIKLDCSTQRSWKRRAARCSTRSCRPRRMRQSSPSWQRSAAFEDPRGAGRSL